MRKLLASLAILSMLVSCSIQKEMPIAKIDYIPVKVDIVKVSSLKRFTDLNGYIQPSEIVPIVIPPNQNIKKVHVEESSVVLKDDLLVSLDTNLLDKKIRSLLTQKNEIDKHLKNRKKNKAETNKSFFSIFSNTSQTEDVVDEVSKMNSNLLKSKQFEIASALEELKMLKEKSNIRTPINGVVTNIEVKENSIPNPTSPSLFVANLDTIEGVFLANQFQVQNIKSGQSVVIYIDGFKDEILSEVISVSSIPKAGTEMYEVKVRFNNNNINLRGGMKASATVITKLVDKALTVPVTSIFYIKNQPYVYKVVENRAIAQKVSLGIRQNEHYQITSGLKRGESIINDGKESVRDGDLVKIK
jgi:RND family efflux transporter MFP subunit